MQYPPSLLSGLSINVWKNTVNTKAAATVINTKLGVQNDSWEASERSLPPAWSPLYVAPAHAGSDAAGMDGPG